MIWRVTGEMDDVVTTVFKRFTLMTSTQHVRYLCRCRDGCSVSPWRKQRLVPSTYPLSMVSPDAQIPDDDKFK